MDQDRIDAVGWVMAGQSLGVQYRATMQLRWRVPPETTTNPPVLEQMWQGSDGTQKWEPIPRVVVPNDDI